MPTAKVVMPFWNSLATSDASSDALLSVGTPSVISTRTFLPFDRSGAFGVNDSSDLNAPPRALLVGVSPAGPDGWMRPRSLSCCPLSTNASGTSTFEGYGPAQLPFIGPNGVWIVWQVGSRLSANVMRPTPNAGSFLARMSSKIESSAGTTAAHLFESPMLPEPSRTISM